MQQKAITKIFDKTAGCKRLAVLFLYINKTLTFVCYDVQ